MKKKRFWFNCVEEAVLNPKFLGFRYFRVEVFDRKSKSGYAIYEGRFLLPEELFDKFYNLLDGYETDLPLNIRIDLFDKTQFPDIYKKYYE